jgi:NADH:ubiquinone oxidoreductase subunit 3 (subunit A)
MIVMLLAWLIKTSRGSLISFLGILLVGYVYALKKRAFDWKT